MRSAPVTALCAVMLGVAGWWAFDSGGFAVEQWAPAGIAVVALLVAAILIVPNRWRSVPIPVRLAALGLFAYAAWSLVSIAWARDPGAALEGGSRTLLYALVFCLFALWPLRGAPAMALVAGWTLLIAVAGVVLAVRLTGGAELAQLFKADRLRAPTGYPNATAALLMMPVLPAVIVAASRSVPWWSRGVFAAVATGLACLALLTVSRGAVFSAPIAILALLVVVPGRLRHLYALTVVGLGVMVCAPRLLDIADAVEAGAPANALGDALRPVAFAALAVAVVVTLAAWVECRRPLRGAVAERVGFAARLVAIGAIGLATVGAGVVVGDPVARADSAWESFKGGYESNDEGSNRLVGGLGSSRYDFYRVGLEVWRDDPVVGIGADGFFQDYLRRGTSGETPRYPHSMQIRTLAQTGIIGALLLAGALLAAAVAAMQAMRTGSGLRRTAAAAAALAVIYWLVHGSVDWFWEWGGLGLPAFALLGLSCGLSRPAADEAPSSARRRYAADAPQIDPERDAALGPERRGYGATWWRLVGVAAVATMAVPFAVLVAAEGDQRRAVELFAEDPLAAYRLLDRAARINPFSAAPETLAGSIALRYGDLPRADAAFGRALERVPTDQYSTLCRGAILSARGRRVEAERLLRRATVLAPRDPLAREALAIVGRGGTIDIEVLTGRILRDAARLVS